ncbi:hypothetical protein [Cohnella abietis]|uniref:hypothetical protein n=1 Tax=Cohnella abietis TaxID=2507935 RepID=UPI00102E5B53|nr:hypothetical protein [Cohnella abietis]
MLTARRAEAVKNIANLISSPPPSSKYDEKHRTAGQRHLFKQPNQQEAMKNIANLISCPPPSSEYD